jgi:phage portal protein BeeE
MQTRNGAYLFDGVKAIPISAYPEEAWRTALGVPTRGSGELTELEAWRVVPVLYRAIDIRANAVATMPYGLYADGRDVSETPQAEPYHALLSGLLFRLEASLCLYGAGYALKERGALTGEELLRWVATPGISPRYDSRGVVGYTRMIAGEKKDIPADQVANVWMPHPGQDLGPAPGPATIALMGAGVLNGLDQYLAYYWKRGAIKAYLIKAKGNPRREDREKIKTAWSRLLTGIRNAFKVEIFGDDLSFEAIGDALKDTTNPELRKGAIEDVLTAMGVPFSLVMAGAANYATAKVDDLHFYTKTAIPAAARIGEALNAQYFKAIGLTLTWHPERLEVMQQAQLETAQSLTSLVGKPVMTIDEARQWLGLGPAPAELTATPPPPPAPFTPTDQTTPPPPAGGPQEAATGASKAWPLEAWPADLEEGYPDDSAFWAEEAATDFFTDHPAVKRAPRAGRRVGPWTPNNHPRGPDGRFVRTAGSETRQRERDEARAAQGAQRQRLRLEQLSARQMLSAQLVRRPGEQYRDFTARRAAARRDLVAEQRQARRALATRMAEERLRLRERHDQDRVQEMGRLMAERRAETPRALSRAYGNNPNKGYDLRHRLIDMDEVQASNLASGAINPAYDPRLQPRDRSRAASQAQIDAVARGLNPDVVAMDFHRIDAGSPIVDAAGNVLSGNGRTLALQRAADLHPDRYAAYKETLKARAKELGIDPADVDRLRRPLLVRELLGEDDPAAFAREANTSQTLRMSPLEQARVDAQVLRDRDVLRLGVKDDQGIDAALRDRDNAPFVQAFLATVPDNERATLLTRNGDLNQMGLYRMKAALYSKVFPGEAGERMAESMLESLDPSLKNVQNGIAGALPAVARARALMASGDRDQELDLMDDMARAIDVLARIKDNPALTANTPADKLVQKYLAQGSLFDRELTPDQERLLVHIDQIARRPTAVRDLLARYADLVEESTPTGQGDMFGGSTRMTRQELLDRLLGGAVASEPSQGSLF